MIIPIGVTIASLIFYRNRTKQLLKISGISILVAMILSPMLSLLTAASDSPTRESFAVPSFQIACTYYYDGSIPDELNDIFELQKSSTEWAEDYALGLASAHPMADFSKANIEVTPELIGAWAELGMRNPMLYLKAWVELEYPFWIATTDNHVMGIEFEQYDQFINSAENSIRNGGQQSSDNAFITLLRSDKSALWHLPSSLYEKLISLHLPIISDAAVLLLFDRALPFYTLLVCLATALYKRNAMALFAAIPVFCVWLSLVLFAPIALMRYALEMYYAIPVLFILCARCKTLRLHAARKDAQ